MCQKWGESVSVPLTGAVSGVVMSQDGIGTNGWYCNRTDCPLYGSICPFSW